MWSTIVDAPITYGLSLKEFKQYMKSEYGKQGWDGPTGIDESIQRANKNGASWQDGTTLEQTIRDNRAGDGETELDLNGIITRYITERPSK